MRCGNERERTICHFVISRKKQMDDSFSCACPATDNEFRHNIVKVVCESTRLSPCGSTATLTML